MAKDIEAEISVLAGIWKHGADALVDVSDFVSTTTFAEHTHQIFFECFKEALSKTDKLDIPVFLSTAAQLNLSEIAREKIDLIGKLENTEIHLPSVRIIAQRIARIALARAAQGKLREQMSRLENVTGEETATEILGMVEKPGYDLQRMLNTVEENGQLIGKGCVDLVERLIANPNREIGISTGMKEYDRAIGGGVRRKGFALIGARPKAGKSSLAANVALFVGEKLKVPVLYLDTEMDAEQHQYRLLANLTSIPVTSVEHSKFTGNALFVQQLRAASRKIENLPITHEVVAGKPFEEILSIARRWAIRKVGYHESGRLNNCLMIYDYFKLMDQSNLKYIQEYAAIGFQAQALSNFCGELDLPCLALVQLNKEQDISQSDRLSWAATSISFLREKDEDEILQDGIEYGNRKLVYDRGRNGEGLDKSNYINIDFNGSFCRLSEIGTAFEMRDEKRIGKSGFDIKDEDLF